ncbi:DUF4124 domain-containing protein [Corallincola luteus]|uniref:DUF4124 domain-containing protein n=1 Tax=Corallincola luteus TaxID=1775177 RepID=A0ABY2AM04_9GAMM|nr:DUF4124 domain-containing protein [Corallincola luteus]TCI03989.1 DUF4124 domain-containing protein [Corallincola luteus]
MKPKYSLSLLLLCALLVGALAVALKPDRYRHILPDQVVHSLRTTYELLIAQLPVEEAIEAPQPELIGQTVSAPERTFLGRGETRHIPYQRRGECIDQTLGEVAKKPTLSVFTWVDDNGVTHYSDKRAGGGEAKQIKLSTGDEMDYYLLDLKTHGVHKMFKDQLRARIKKSFLFYRSLLGQGELRKIAVNMQVFANSAHYADYRRSIKASVRADAPGFYSPSRNESVLLYLGEQQTTETAVHEAVHSITSGLIGETGPWLTEGLSEYLENLQVKMQYAEVSPSPDWRSEQVLRFSPVPLHILLNTAHQEFYGSSSKDFYGTSWAFIYFLMDDPTREQWLAQLLLQEKADRCDVTLGIAQLERVTGVPISQLQRTFNHWLRTNTLTAHRY